MNSSKKEIIEYNNIEYITEKDQYDKVVLIGFAHEEDKLEEEVFKLPPCDIIAPDAFKDYESKNFIINPKTSILSEGAFKDYKTDAGLKPPHPSSVNFVVSKDEKTVFWINPEIEDLVIPEGIESIKFPSNGYNVFGKITKENIKTKSITFPKSLKLIGFRVFAEMPELETVHFPEQNENELELGSESFTKCRKLKLLTIPKNVTMYDGVFSNCSSLKVLTCDAKQIPASAFENCEELTQVFLSNTEAIHSNAFAQCRMFSMDFPDTLDTIERGAFKNNPNLGRIELKDKIYMIGAAAFENCVNLEIVNGLEKVNNLKERAFNNTNITFVSLNNTLKYLGQAVFANCRSLTHVSINSDVEIFDILYGCKNINMVMLENATEISNKAFADVPMSEIYFPSSRTTLGLSIFGTASIGEVNMSDMNMDYFTKGHFKGASIDTLVMPRRLRGILDSSLFDTKINNLIVYTNRITRDNGILDLSFSQANINNLILIGKMTKEDLFNMTSCDCDINNIFVNLNEEIKSVNGIDVRPLGDCVNLFNFRKSNKFLAEER